MYALKVKQLNPTLNKVYYNTNPFIINIVSLSLSPLCIDKLNQQPAVPSDLIDRVSAMQNAIDHLTTEVNKVS